MYEAIYPHLLLLENISANRSTDCEDDPPCDDNCAPIVINSSSSSRLVQVPLA